MKYSSTNDILESLIPDAGAKAFITELINSFPGFIMLLDEDRRLVYSNRKMMDALSIDDFETVFRLRPGDLFQCVNSFRTTGGCGTAEGCEYCGAMNSMTASRTEGKTVANQFRVLGASNGKPQSSVFRFTSTPFHFNETFFYLVTLEDINNEIRKEELEQIFFHDLMNSIGGLFGVIELLKENEDIEPLYIDILEASYNSLYDTINEQKQYSLAESGKLRIKKEMLHPQDLIIEATLPFNEKKGYKAALEIAGDTADLIFTSDSSLLSRVLINMIKNALEASEEKDTVTVGATQTGHQLRFWVHNPGYMPRETQLQIFERSYTTKGHGRGLGTFSMKLLGESCLGGKVDFSSEEETGTTFWIDLPLDTQ
ncbi:MAG: HAMP domain-containing sensor histidine kinase [Bacteroidales bacterium]